MEALIVVLVMHCGVPEAVILDSPDKIRIAPVPIERRAAVLAQFLEAEAAGARTAKVVVEDATGEKCKVST